MPQETEPVNLVPLKRGIKHTSLIRGWEGCSSLPPQSPGGAGAAGGGAEQWGGQGVQPPVLSLWGEGGRAKPQ